MTNDALSAVLDRLFRDDDVAGDWPDVLRRAGTTAKAPRSHLVDRLTAPHRRWLGGMRHARVVIAAVATALVIAGGALAAVYALPWWKPEIAKATLLVETPLHYHYDGIPADTKIALWQAPDQTGGQCLIVNRSATVFHWGRGSHSAVCVQHGSFQPTRLPLSVEGGSSVLDHGVYDHLVLGWANPKSGIVKVVLHEPSGATTLAFRHGWFLGDARPTKKLDVPDAYLVGVDASGREIARVLIRY
jgi:hypothetical protein